LHAAALLGTRYVGIFGPTWPANFQPIPLRPSQGQLALPALPCRTPQYFVGGGPPWRRPCCQGTCRALQTIAPETVLAHCESLLRQRFAPAETTLDEWRVSHTPHPDEMPAK
jgi:ADP-heptose:LPS heptosyltransferase